MTDQEKRQQRVNLMIDLEEAQEELAHLRERALRVADGLESAARKMRENADCQPSNADFSPEQELSSKLSQRHQEAMDHEQATSLIENLRMARQRVVQLNQRRSQLAGSSVLVSIPGE